MLPMGSAMPRAGRMRPKTMSLGIFTTPRDSPVRTMTLSATLVKKPKKAFQSPGTHSRTRYSPAVPACMRPPCRVSCVCREVRVVLGLVLDHVSTGAPGDGVLEAIGRGDNGALASP